jgi:hypothetical protein
MSFEQNKDATKHENQIMPHSNVEIKKIYMNNTYLDKIREKW